MGNVKINKDDKARILLTELLPYEVPMLFSNEGFYSIITNKKYDKFFDKIKNLSGVNYGIPFNYEIRKSIEGDTRTLSVIHPYCQFNFIELYEKYDLLMLHLCSKSPFSLRKISKVAKYYYSPDFVFDEDAHKNSDLETIELDTKYIKSYFTYQPIDLIYKFYDRNEYQRLEQRFNFLMEFDVSKCFYNIYTHSVTWAVKDKESAKRNSGETSFENRFDKIMQLANYNETNGIVVGPEVSRIFAEIILQQIDINVLIKLEEKYKFGIDFEIRRYVDDYFVFSNDEKILKFIKKTFQNELNFYKLYLNPNKGETKISPFITTIAVGKRELKHLLNGLYNDLIIETISDEEDNAGVVKSIKKVRSPYSISQNFIKDFQCIVKKNNLTYDILSKDIIRFFKSKIVKILKDDKISKDKEVFQNFLLLVFDINFYAYSLNINSNTTFKLSQIIILVCKFLDKKDEDLRHLMFSKILKEADFVLTNFQRKSKQNETNIETLNLLIALKKLGSSYLFSEKRLKEIFGINDKTDLSNLNYFHIVTLFYYIDINPNFKNFKNEIEESVILKFIENKNPFTKSELTLLFFDFICCPFVEEKSKLKIIRETKYCKNGESNVNLQILIKEIADEKKWFMDWNIDIDLERVLKKKEWGSSY